MLTAEQRAQLLKVLIGLVIGWTIVSIYHAGASLPVFVALVATLILLGLLLWESKNAVIVIGSGIVGGVITFFAPQVSLHLMDVPLWTIWAVLFFAVFRAS